METVNEMLKFFRHTESIFQPVHKTALWILIIIKVEWNVQTSKLSYYVQLVGRGVTGGRAGVLVPTLGFNKNRGL